MNKTPSLFWPLQTLVTVLLLTVIYQLVGVMFQRQAYRKSVEQLLPTYQQAVQIIRQRDALVQDLVSTSAEDAGAAQIVKEFQIPLPKAEDKGKAK